MRKLILARNAGVLVLLVAGVSAQGPNPRYGKWTLKSDAPAPASSSMSYEPINGGNGMNDHHRRGELAAL